MARQCLDAVVPIFRDKLFNPFMLITMENNILGALNEEAVDIADVTVLQSTSGLRELSERKIGLGPRHRNVRHNPHGKVGSQGDNLIQELVGRLWSQWPRDNRS